MGQSWKEGWEVSGEGGREEEEEEKVEAGRGGVREGEETRGGSCRTLKAVPRALGCRFTGCFVWPCSKFYS